jgi:LPS export ABC transporter protein LptC
LIILILAAVIAAGCGDDEIGKDKSATLPVNETIPDQVTSNARIYLYSGGHKTTDLQADELAQFTNQDSTIATNIRARFFDSTGALVSTLRSDYGYIREKDNFLAVSGSVIVVGEDSVQVRTEYLEWDAANEEVETDSFVTVIRENDTLNSFGLVTDPGLQDITFKKQVSGTLTDMDKMKNENK